MQIKTFLGKVNVDGLRLMDEHINDWVQEHQVKIHHVTQVMGMEQFGDSTHSEPVVVTSIWYESGK